MTTSDLRKISSTIKEALSKHRIYDALSELAAMAAATMAPWTITEEISRVKDSYILLMKYALNGATDPSREAVLTDISSKIMILSDCIVRERDKIDSNKQYFNILRYEEMQRGVTISSLVDEYASCHDKLSLSLLTNAGNINDEDGTPLYIAQERRATRLFNKIWVSYPYSVEDSISIKKIFESKTLPRHFQQLIVSAVMLGALEYYDERRLLLLADAYSSSDKVLSIKALCAMLILMGRHSDHLDGKNIRLRLSSLSETPTWESDIKMAFMQLIRARDTERINRKVQNELLPEIMKMRPEITKRMRGLTDIEDLASLEENPEWEKILKESGLADKMKELSDMSLDGGDIMMSTFSGLKTFPFFNEPANWFLPYYPEHSINSGTKNNHIDGLFEIIASANMLCDGDKYSMALLSLQMPGHGASSIKSQLDLQNINFAELKASELQTDSVERERCANKYVQDLYRFFKLYRRKNEFPDIFANPLMLLNVEPIASLLNNKDTIALLAEFYFKREYYSDALSLFTKLESDSIPTAELYQKIGYCMQQLNDISGALEMYERSELINSDSLWTLKRIAACSRLLGMHSKALSYMKRIESKRPDDLSLAVNIGNTLLELNRPSDALKYYYKVEFLDKDPKRVNRQIAWCLLLTGDYEKSNAYFENIINDRPTASDYLNAAHLNLICGRFKEAARLYTMSLTSLGFDKKSFLTDIDSDRKILLDAGVNPTMINLVIDESLNNASSLGSNLNDKKD